MLAADGADVPSMNTSMAAKKRGRRSASDGGALSREAFTRAAREIVEAHGVQAYSARSLADHLSVDPTAVYRYFPSIDGVLASVVDDLFDGIELPDSGTPRQRVESFLIAVHERFYDHPNLVPLLLISRDTLPETESLGRAGVALLDSMGLRGDDLALCHRLLESYLAGMHAFDLGGAPAHLEVRRARLRRIDHPDIDRAAASLEAVDELNRRSFLTGLRLLLDYCESRAATSK